MIGPRRPPGTDQRSADLDPPAPAPGVAPPAYDLRPLPEQYRMRVVDERAVHSALSPIFDLACDVERWPRHLRHYRYVRFRERRADGGGLVEMSANRPFGPLDWPTWWLSEMQIVSASDAARQHPSATPGIRFRHVAGVTAGMEVEWSFHPRQDAPVTMVRIVHVWHGPSWPLVGSIAARGVIGPVFIHGIASRTLAGLAVAAEADRTGAAVGMATSEGVDVGVTAPYRSRGSAE